MRGRSGAREYSRLCGIAKSCILGNMAGEKVMKMNRACIHSMRAFSSLCYSMSNLRSEMREESNNESGASQTLRQNVEAFDEQNQEELSSPGLETQTSRDVVRAAEAVSDTIKEDGRRERQVLYW
jgi:hypothetical protein